MTITNTFLQGITIFGALVTFAELLTFGAWRFRSTLGFEGLDKYRSLATVGGLANLLAIVWLMKAYPHCWQFHGPLKVASWCVGVCLVSVLIKLIFPLAQAPDGVDNRHKILIIGICYFGSIVGGTTAVSSMGLILLTEKLAIGPERYLVQANLDNQTPITKTVFTSPGTTVYLQAKHNDCIPDTDGAIEWTSNGRQSDELKNGRFTSSQEDQFLVRAKAAHDDVEGATATIIVAATPGVERHPTPYTDIHGNEGIVDVMVVVTSKHSWTCGSDEYIEGGGTGRDFIKELADGHAFDPYQTLIAIGTASHEGEPNAQYVLADDRSQKLADWITAASQASEHHRDVRPWNQGQFRRKAGLPKSCSPDSARERPLVIVGVATPAKGFDTREAVLYALKKAKIPFLNPDPPGFVR